jgi:DNA-binding NarL/FixJ family response regulator
MRSKRGASVRGRVRVLIVDDHPLVREGLTARISAQRDLEICGQASDIDQALSLAGSTQPAIMIVDLALKRGSGLELIKKVRAGGASPRILVVSAYAEALFAERALRAGAQGYLNKQEAPGSIIEAIRVLLRGELYLSADMAQRLAGQALSGNVASRGVEGLSDRELQIFQLIGRGNGTRAIAEQLHLSVHTIESHREKIRIKLDLRNGIELLQRAVQWTLENGP